MRPIQILILMTIGWYLVLSLGHFLNQRPLWNDELCVLNNIVQLDPAKIFERPLLSNQAFPRPYLVGIQQFSKSFNYHLLALRFFPFLSMLAAFVVWFRITQRTLDNTWYLVLYIACWCGSVPMVYYAAELKSYSMDVLAAGLIVWFLLDKKEIQKNFTVYRLILFFLPWLALLSYPAIFLLILPLWNLIEESINQRKCLPELSVYLSSCLLILGLLYYFDFRVSARYLLEENWHDYFISFHSWKDFFSTFGKGMNNLIGRRFAENPRWIKIPSRAFLGMSMGYMLVMGIRQLRKDRFILSSLASISLVIFCLQLLLAIFHVYPFAVPRMSLFFSPLLFIMLVLGLRHLQERFKPWGMVFQCFLAGYLVFISLGITWDIFVKKDLSAESKLYGA